MLARGDIVGTLSKSLLLFTMNWLDAQLTLVWIRLNVATEGNALMARVLQHGPRAYDRRDLLRPRHYVGIALSDRP